MENTTQADPTEDILAQLGLNDLPPDNPDDQIVWEPPSNQNGGGGAPGGNPPPPAVQPDLSQYVPRSAYDELQRSLNEQMQALQRQVGELAAGRLQQQPPSPSQPPFAPGGSPFGYIPPAPVPGQPPYVDQRAQLDQMFWQQPTAVTAQIAQAAALQERQRLEAAQGQSNQVLARTLIAQLDTSYAAQHPDLAPLVRTEMASLIAETPPAELANLAMSGKLAEEYDKAFFQEVGKKLAPVYRKAREKRVATTQANEPPAIGGGSLGGRNPSLPAGAQKIVNAAQGANGQQAIRKSELSADELQVYEWLQTPAGRASGLSIHDIIAQRGNS